MPLIVEYVWYPIGALLSGKFGPNSCCAQWLVALQQCTIRYKAYKRYCKQEGIEVKT